MDIFPELDETIFDENKVLLQSKHLERQQRVGLGIDTRINYTSLNVGVATSTCGGDDDQQLILSPSPFTSEVASSTFTSDNTAPPNSSSHPTLPADVTLADYEVKWGFTYAELQAATKVVTALFHNPALFVGDPYLAESRLYTMTTRDKKTKRTHQIAMKVILSEEKSRRKREKRHQDIATMRKTTMMKEREGALRALLVTASKEGGATDAGGLLRINDKAEYEGAGDGGELMENVNLVCGNTEDESDMRNSENNEETNDDIGKSLNNKQNSHQVQDKDNRCEKITIEERMEELILYQKRCLAGLELAETISNPYTLLPHVTRLVDLQEVARNGLMRSKNHENSPTSNFHCVDAEIDTNMSSSTRKKHRHYYNEGEGRRLSCSETQEPSSPVDTIKEGESSSHLVRREAVSSILPPFAVVSWQCHLQALYNRFWPIGEFNTQMVRALPIHNPFSAKERALLISPSVCLQFPFISSSDHNIDKNSSDIYSSTIKKKHLRGNFLSLWHQEEGLCLLKDSTIRLVNMANGTFGSLMQNQASAGATAWPREGAVWHDGEKADYGNHFAHKNYSSLRYQQSLEFDKEVAAYSAADLCGVDGFIYEEGTKPKSEEKELIWVEKYHSWLFSVDKQRNKKSNGDKKNNYYDRQTENLNDCKKNLKEGIEERNKGEDSNCFSVLCKGLKENEFLNTTCGNVDSIVDIRKNIMNNGQIGSSKCTTLRELLICLRQQCSLYLATNNNKQHQSDMPAKTGDENDVNAVTIIVLRAQEALTALDLLFSYATESINKCTDESSSLSLLFLHGHHWDNIETSGINSHSCLIYCCWLCLFALFDAMTRYFIKGFFDNKFSEIDVDEYGLDDEEDEEGKEKDDKEKGLGSEGKYENCEEQLSSSCFVSSVLNSRCGYLLVRMVTMSFYCCIVYRKSITSDVLRPVNHSTNVVTLGNINSCNDGSCHNHNNLLELSATDGGTCELFNGIKLVPPSTPPEAELDGTILNEGGTFERHIGRSNVKPQPALITDDDKKRNVNINVGFPYQDAMLYAKPVSPVTQNEVHTQSKYHGIILSLTQRTSLSLTMNRTQKCHICKGRYNFLHPYYYSLCRPCGEYNYNKRVMSRNLRDKVVLLTGCRIKIGYAMALSLLRCGATLLGTTRFVHDGLARFQQEPDFNEWKHRLHLFAIDLRDMWLVTQFCSYISYRFPKLFAIINNAAQTIARTSEYTAELRKLEANPSPDLRELFAQDSLAYEWHEYFSRNSSVTVGISHHLEYHPTGVPILEDFSYRKVSQEQGEIILYQDNANSISDSCREQLSEAEIAEFWRKRYDRYDTYAEESDKREKNSWTMEMHEVKGAEAAEVMAINALSPFILNSKLKHCLMNRDGDDNEGDNGCQVDEKVLNDQNFDKNIKDHQQNGIFDVISSSISSFPASSPPLSKRSLKRLKEDVHLHKSTTTYHFREARFIINVSAMEGQFYRYKQTTHPHTNMAKAALNMMTRTSAADYASDGIYMNSVDTGWITDESPTQRKIRRAEQVQLCPLDEVDAATRCLDLIYTDSREFGKFFKNFKEISW